MQPLKQVNEQKKWKNLKIFIVYSYQILILMKLRDFVQWFLICEMLNQLIKLFGKFIMKNHILI